MAPTISLHRFVNQIARRTIHGEHVEEYAPYLRIEVAANRGAGRYIRLHDVADDLDSLAVLQDGRVVGCLLDDFVPLRALATSQSGGKLTAWLGNAISSCINRSWVVFAPCALTM
jgi:hypothetical protein